MSAPARVALLLVVLGGAAFAVHACSQSPAVAPPPAPSTSAPRTGTSHPVPDPEAAERRAEDERRVMDEKAHAAVRAFQAKVYDPFRDDGLAEATGTLRMDIDGKGATYRFQFDGSQKDGRQLTTETVNEEIGLHAGAAKQALRFAFLGVRGGFAQVMSYLPPIQWQFLTARDGKPLVVMPPHLSELGTSYRLDDEGIVTVAGTTDGKSKVVTRLTYDLRRGLRVLRASDDDGGKSSVHYDYDDDPRGVLLLRHATLVDGEHRCEASITWDVVRRR